MLVGQLVNWGFLSLGTRRAGTFTFFSIAPDLILYHVLAKKTCLIIDEDVLLVMNLVERFSGYNYNTLCFIVYKWLY